MVFTQLMGWQGVGDLWMGRVMDTDYTKCEGLLKILLAFQQETDKVESDGKKRVLPKDLGQIQQHGWKDTS